MLACPRRWLWAERCCVCGPGLLLLTTPFTLVRLLSCHCFLFLRLSHLVLDEVDQLFTRAPEQVQPLLHLTHAWLFCWLPSVLVFVLLR